MDEVIHVPLPAQPPQGNRSSGGQDRLCTLDGLILGPENRLVEVVLRAVLGDAPSGHNPIVLYGPSGSGKSHLARGLADAWKKHLGRGALCVTAADFGKHLRRANQTQAIAEFRGKYRRAGLLVIEDFQHIEELPEAQEELVGTLDAQVEQGHWVVVTSSVAPADLPGVLPGLRGRLTAGLSLSLALPGPAARLAIWQRVAVLRRLALPPPVLAALVHGIRGTVGQLLAAAADLESLATPDTPLDGRQVRQYLQHCAATQSARVREIAAATARSFSLKLSDLRGPSQRRTAVRARGVAMYLARQFTHESLQQIGAYFGNRDHTTVLHACRKTTALLQSEVVLQKAVLHLEQEIGKSC